MHEWVLFLHVSAVFTFLTAHGVQVAAMWRMRGEPDPQRTLRLLDELPNLLLLRLTLALVVITGLIGGVIEPWWQQWWMWLSLAILAGIWLAMWRWGAGYFSLVQRTATAAVEERVAGSGSTTAMNEFTRARTGWQAGSLMVVGFVGLGVILWLMIFKPA